MAHAKLNDHDQGGFCRAEVRGGLKPNGFAATYGRFAVQRGALVSTVEQIDPAGVPLVDLFIRPNASQHY